MKPVVAFILLSFLLIAGCTSAQTTNSATNQSVPQVQPAQASNKVTAANFAKIKSGMTLQQAEAILSKSELVSESEVAGIKSAVYIWKQSGFGGNITAVVQDGTIISKSQFGLK
jgi:PBP1b-binding outer membrane lipoprotein LpoB